MILLASVIILSNCENAVKRDTNVTTREEYERKKPLLLPIGGVYVDSVTVSTSARAENLEYSVGQSYSPWPQQNLILSESTGISVRDIKIHEYATSENYQIIHDFPKLTLYPPPGEYLGAQVIALLGIPRNAIAEVNSPAGFIPYKGEDGLVVSQGKTFEIRLCTLSRCSSSQFFTYSITAAFSPSERPLTATELTELNAEARNRYSQTQTTGLPALLDEAKSRVIRNESLIEDAALRQRFFAQDNTQAAANLCTTIARYLYVKARRLALGATEPALPDFPDYYITHVARGNITTDTLGQNFDWVLNGTALVRPYLPGTALAAFEFDRTAAYPTDYSLIDALNALAPGVTLLRDGPSATSNTHTFIAIKNGVDYTMIDTYFSPFSGSPLRGWSGFTGYYAYRFGPLGSRFLHYVYGY